MKYRKNVKNNTLVCDKVLEVCYIRLNSNNMYKYGMKSDKSKFIGKNKEKYQGG